MENFEKASIEFESSVINDLISNLRDIYTHNQINFADLCFTIYKICDYFKNQHIRAKDDIYYNSTMLLEKFGFDKKAVSRYKNSFERFCQGNDIKNVRLKTFFEGYSPSKLFELLPLSYATLEEIIDEGIINSSMTVKELRGIVKDLTNGISPDKVTEVVVDNEEEINEEEIPMVYDPLKEYDFEYFKSKSKNQLINMIWELQKAYQKLKSKKR